jgi:hypothetical protein
MNIFAKETHKYAKNKKTPGNRENYFRRKYF